MKIIVVTPAGRRRYLELLAYYISADKHVDQWYLWDNCRDPADRTYLQALAANPKIKIISLSNSNGDNRSINKFYSTMNDAEAFYVKLDDDICYLTPGFFGRFAQKALAHRENIWFSPIVINNAICTWLLAFHRRISVSQGLSCQAGCDMGWRNPEFSILLHRFFLEVVRSNRVSDLYMPDAISTIGRFSINCIGIFGEDRNKLGDCFCPPNVDDEDHISSTLPMITGRPGRIIGDELVAHFSYFTQERLLLKTNILSSYYGLVDQQVPRFDLQSRTLKRRLLQLLDDHRGRLQNKTPISFLNSLPRLQ